MRKIAIFLILLFLSGCDKNKVDIKIKRITGYVNTTETVKVNTYNGYESTDIVKTLNEDGTYTITIVVKRMNVIEN